MEMQLMWKIGPVPTKYFKPLNTIGEREDKYDRAELC